MTASVSHEYDMTTTRINITRIDDRRLLHREQCDALEFVEISETAR